MAWAVWRMRNDAVIGGQQPSLSQCQHYFNETVGACQNFAAAGTVHKNLPDVVSVQQGSSNDGHECYVCYVDGSWSDDGRGGVGACLTKNERLIKWLSKSVVVLGPAQSEARAVLEAYKLMQRMGCHSGMVVSDSLETVDSLSHSQPLIHDWRASGDIWSAWTIQNQQKGRYMVLYKSREDQNMHAPHKLANLGRIMSWDKEGTSLLDPAISDVG